MRPRGITLIETVVYIGILMVALPTFVVFLLQAWSVHLSLDARSRMEQTASLIFLELENSLSEAQTIALSSSTLGEDNGVLIFQDGTGQTVTIDRPTEQIDFSGTTQNVNRLRLQKNSGITYLTDPDLYVTAWHIDPVRANGTLTGLRIELGMEMVNAHEDAYRQANFSAATTFSLSGQTIEH